MEELLDIAQVAAYLGVSERTVYERVRSGALPATRVGRLWRVPASDLQAWLESGRPVRPEDPGSGTEAARTDVPPARAELERHLEWLQEPLERRLEFVALLSRGVRALGWPAPVVVGGHAVEFYTGGDYATVDIDLVAAAEPIATVLGDWGFQRQGRHWFDERLGLVVEAPGRQLDPDPQAHLTSVRVGTDVVLVLGIEDLIVDRLSAAEHWSDDESRMWAESLLRSDTAVDTAYLRDRADAEGVREAVESLIEDTGVADA
jgi:excisionase family DNA binding protein